MRDRPAEGGEPQPQKDQQNVEGGEIHGAKMSGVGDSPATIGQWR
jgi:hypothetical protein